MLGRTCRAKQAGHREGRNRRPHVIQHTIWHASSLGQRQELSHQEVPEALDT